LELICIWVMTVNVVQIQETYYYSCMIKNTHQHCGGIIMDSGDIWCLLRFALTKTFDCGNKFVVGRRYYVRSIGCANEMTMLQMTATVRWNAKGAMQLNAQTPGGVHICVFDIWPAPLSINHKAIANRLCSSIYYIERQPIVKKCNVFSQFGKMVRPSL